MMKLLTLIAAAVALATCTAQSQPLELKKGDHISYIGNTLADRMQHYGWLETLIYSQFPDQELVFRDLGFSGDELNLRLRSEAFGTPDEWLTKMKTDVIFAFFGYNESFAGQAGLEKFKTDLDKFIKATLGQKYNGQTAPRLVLFSPIGHENLHNPNLPDGVKNNEQIKLYTAAMAEVAKNNNVLFVDAFTPSLEIYAKSKAPLTIDGVHLNETGDRLLAPVMMQGLFANYSKAKQNIPALEKVCSAVLDKNLYWFERYRTVDGYNVYGGRSHP